MAMEATSGLGGDAFMSCFIGPVVTSTWARLIDRAPITWRPPFRAIGVALTGCCQELSLHATRVVFVNKTATVVGITIDGNKQVVRSAICSYSAYSKNDNREG